MGGYVKMVGEGEKPIEGGKGATVYPAKAFNGKPLGARFLIVFAVPAMNFVLAAVIAGLMFMLVGRPVAPPLVGRSGDRSLAEAAGVNNGGRLGRDVRHQVHQFEEQARHVQQSP